MRDVEFYGIQLVSLVLGAAGAVLGISYTPKMTKREMFAAMIAGLACAALFPQLAAHYFALPAVLNNVLAFIFGIGGMFIVPGVLALWRGFANDPWAFIDRLRSGKKTGDDK